MRLASETSADCQSFDAELDQGIAPKLSARAVEHLQGCDRCRRLYGWFNQDMPSAEVSPAVWAQIQEWMAKSFAPVTPLPAPRVLAARFLLVFLLFAASAAGMMGPAGFRYMRPVQWIGICSVLAFGAALISASLAWQMSPGSLRPVSARAAIVTLAAGFLTGIAILFPWNAPEAFLARGWPCLGGGLMMAVPAAGLFWTLVRRGYLMPTAQLGATLGAISGLVGASVLQFTCTRQDAGHLLVWHGSVLIVSIAAGILVAKVAPLFISRRMDSPIA